MLTEVSSLTYLQLLVEIPVSLQPELRAAVSMPEDLGRSGRVQRQVVQLLARSVPHLLRLKQLLLRPVVLQEKTSRRSHSPSPSSTVNQHQVEAPANSLLPAVPVPHTPGWFCLCCR